MGIVQTLARPVARRSVILSGRDQRTVADNWRTNQRLVDTWDRVIKSDGGSLVYLRVVFGTSNERMYRHMGELATLPEGTSVLDVPSGGGTVLRTLGSGHRLDYTAADISPLMLEKVTLEAGARGMDVKTQEADVTSLPFGDGQFDVVASYNGLHCVPDSHAAFRELVRVTRPGGQLRGNIYVKGARGLSDRLIAMWERSNTLAGVVTAATFKGWIEEADFASVTLEHEGAAILFDARKRA
jgi:SAM-dependent methyltransferase